jgi:hypothetical protein
LVIFNEICSGQIGYVKLDGERIALVGPGYAYVSALDGVVKARPYAI